jgi:hypothetical protein
LAELLGSATAPSREAKDREIAERLFISANTVDLRKVYEGSGSRRAESCAARNRLTRALRRS